MLPAGSNRLLSGAEPLFVQLLSCVIPLWEPQSSDVLPSSTATCQKVTGCLQKTLIPLWSPLIHVAQVAFLNLLEAGLVFSSMRFFKM